MDSGAYTFTHPLREKIIIAPLKEVIVYTGPQGSGKTWQAQVHARMYGVDNINDTRIIWSELRTRIAFFKYIKSVHIDKGFLFIEEFEINDPESVALIADLCRKGFGILICTQQEPAIPLPSNFQIVHCKYSRGKEVARA